MEHVRERAQRTHSHLLDEPLLRKRPMAPRVVSLHSL